MGSIVIARVPRIEGSKPLCGRLRQRKRAKFAILGNADQESALAEPIALQFPKGIRVDTGSLVLQSNLLNPRSFFD